ncbi:MAG TPA: DUF1592 domain-containing protein [Polyangiaceae bacterium]|nr:DUF1592 domain-containing protein [Polyangiaceae bacterium]
MSQQVPCRAAMIAFGVLLAACEGTIEGPGSGTRPGEGPTTTPPDGEVTVDPGRVGIHRLNNAEYDNTIRDLLGTSTRFDAVFTVAEEGLHFDNTASALGMTPSQYDGFFEAAMQLMSEALQDATQRSRFLSCTPVALADACARQIIEGFGKRIYRRPLEVAEVERALAVYDADFARAGNGTEAIAEALGAMLASANFLYRVELDAAPTSLTAHSLSGYELASRLSYLHWSSMPDDSLFAAADDGTLVDPAVLEASVDRLLADAKASAFVESFAGQWLDLRKLTTHSTVEQIFPTFTPALSAAMLSEGQRWFQDFLSEDRAISEFFTADFNYVNDTLAAHYGFAAPGSGDELVKMEVASDQRSGFLGLASFLTHTSVPSRTSPTLRGAWILSELLCSPPPPPPANVPQLEESAEPDAMEASGTENVRARLERHREDVACRGCHEQFDPMGLGLERYDGIGRYRESYPNGDAIEPAGVLPDGTPFAGPEELGAILSQDPRFGACAASKLLTYALGRDVVDADAVTLQRLNERWAARGSTFRNLLKEVVLSDAFRFRRGEPE